MDNVEKIFDKDTVEDISRFVEDKMNILQDVKDFKQKDESLSIASEEFESLLSDELKSKFKSIMKLAYQLDEYYFTLAYFLGAKFADKINKI